jgi:guanylate kinase
MPSLNCSPLTKSVDVSNAMNSEPNVLVSTHVSFLEYHTIGALLIYMRAPVLARRVMIFDAPSWWTKPIRREQQEQQHQQLMVAQRTESANNSLTNTTNTTNAYWNTFT